MRAQALVARNLRRLPVERSLSQENLAADAEIDRTYVSRLERGLETQPLLSLSSSQTLSVPASSNSSSCPLRASLSQSRSKVVGGQKVARQAAGRWRPTRNFVSMPL
jgi:DNA-binding XRE family transcriptional regulator